MQLSAPRFAFASLLIACFFCGPVHAQEYKYGPDSQPQNVPHGKVTHGQIISSRAFPGVHHDYWLYVPAQYDGKSPAAVMVFQDGGGFQNVKGPFRVPIVFDNLIAKKQMPITIGIMINPGEVPARDPNAQLNRYERSLEYDGVGDRYARFLIEEVLPRVAKDYKLIDDPNLRAICGSSSGGICAFTVAWERPDAFRRVVSFVGSFTNLRGGNFYSDLIRKTEPKPIRVFQQDGQRDLDIYAGSWFIANQDVAAALEFAGYAHRFDTGTTNHDSKQAGPLFPEAMRWVWQDFDKPIKPPAGERQPIMQILEAGQDWQVVASGFKFTEGPAADAAGNVYFTDIPNNRIHRIDADGKVSVFAENTHGANGLKIGPDGRLYACQSGIGTVVAYDTKTARETKLADGISECNDLAIDHLGNIYVTSPPAKGSSGPGEVWHISPEGRKQRVVQKANGIVFPNGVGFTPDQSQLVVDDTRGVNFWIYQVQPDGTLAHGAPFYTAQITPIDRESGADGLCFDTQGRMYVATRLGLQVFDQAGRVIGIISKPQEAKVKNAWLSNVTFGGKNLDALYITCGDAVYKRKVKAKGMLGFEPPVKPGKPRL